ncbi:NADPH-dependent 2,4-dienoyl-CoA reductase [Oligoflexaceae bacterium]|nr:NADPH-dependent 2,4-dienoyl-CoA reductase [Oligoflexaceae bacterium]
MSSQFKSLAEPITLAGHTLRNRVIMGSMHTGLEEERDGFAKMAAFYRERAEGGVGLIITGGIAPEWRGWVAPFSGKLTSSRIAKKHRVVTETVHKVGGKIVMQILHAGRYSYQPFSVAPSRIKSPITPFTPFSLSKSGVEKRIRQFVRCAKLAKEAGYDGVEVMGSEGYLINQFLCARTNTRKDKFGGSYENRMRFALEICSGIRKACGSDFILVFRLSMLDLVENGSQWAEVLELSKRLEGVGVDLFNTGIGWHEARVPTIATCVPRGVFSKVTRKLRDHCTIPVAAVNRINTPEVAEKIISDGDADMVTLARPFLADANFVAKALAGRSDRINTCIACNQACLDHVFRKQRASCMVNPRACHETEYSLALAEHRKTVAVVGGGPAGMAAAVYAAERGHRVTLYEQKAHLGGQFYLAQQIPGKEEFKETIKYFENRLADLEVTVELNSQKSVQTIVESGAEAVALATGVTPRTPSIPIESGAKVFSYDQAILRSRDLGDVVAVIGAGGIGVDTTVQLMGREELSLDADEFMRFWGIDSKYETRGGLVKPTEESAHERHVTLFQRSTGKVGTGVGRTTAWIHRLHLKKERVSFVKGVEYQKITAKGLHYRAGGEDRFFACDAVVFCTGQNSHLGGWSRQDERLKIIGGARDASGVNAKRAIREAFEWAHSV